MRVWDQYNRIPVYPTVHGWRHILPGPHTSRLHLVRVWGQPASWLILKIRIARHSLNWSPLNRRRMVRLGNWFKAMSGTYRYRYLFRSGMSWIRFVSDLGWIWTRFELDPVLFWIRFDSNTVWFLSGTGRVRYLVSRSSISRECKYRIRIPLFIFIQIQLWIRSRVQI